ncbi:YybH family protein [Algoriphagus limi]|uniref:Nuclear transport factor 2 family protein n=1 Tax=Algoriphagus limi TaxID=2975273 RepID=A0ABT2G8C1_9BACT|nr:nuclear transport factor 2 family protein [Algoriphagus limi]MCS5490192.1 nuclear transport factor 2 family protein [Algoriphagus limi]
MKRVLIILMGVIAFSCGEEPNDEQINDAQIPSFDVEAELEAIERSRAQFLLAFKEKRYSELSQFTTSDMIGVNPGTEDWQEYLQLMRNPSGQFSIDSIQMRPKRTVVVSDSVAYDYGTSTLFYTNSEGENIALDYTFLVIMKKDKVDGRWKIHLDVSSGLVLED